MNIFAALFPLTDFYERNTGEKILKDHVQRLFPFSRTCLLRGEADQCFRALLFQAALSYASIGKRVAFYTPSPLETIPSLVHNLIPQSLKSANLDLIQLHYVSSLKEVHQHLILSSSDVIIIDGYLEFPLLQQENRFHIIAACALLRDSYEYLKTKYNNPNLILLCSCTCADASMANVEQRSLFDLAIDIEMIENGDYRARMHLSSKRETSCSINFRISSDEIMPLSATISE